MANTSGEKELRTDWPFTEGLTAGTTKTAGKQVNLIAEESSKVLQRNLAGIR